MSHQINPSHPITTHHIPSHPITSHHIPSHPITSHHPMIFGIWGQRLRDQPHIWNRLLLSVITSSGAVSAKIVWTHRPRVSLIFTDPKHLLLSGSEPTVWRSGCQPIVSSWLPLSRPSQVALSEPLESSSLYQGHLWPRAAVGENTGSSNGFIEKNGGTINFTLID